MTRTIPGHVDSTGKLLERLALVAKVPVVVDGKLLKRGDGQARYEIMPPDNVYISPSVLRQFTCVSGCTACCLPFTLDFTPEEFDTLEWNEEIAEQATRQFGPRWIYVNGKAHKIYTYEQYKDPSCPYLRPTREGGALGCGFWTQNNSTQPLECAAAPQILMTTRGEGNTVIMKRPFGRGWAWKDKPQCEFDPVIDHPGKIDLQFDLSNEIMLMERYESWAQHLGIETHIPEIISGLSRLPQLLRDSGIKMIQVA